MPKTLFGQLQDEVRLGRLPQLVTGIRNFIAKSERTVYQQWLNLAAVADLGLCDQVALNTKDQTDCPIDLTTVIDPAHGRPLRVVGTALVGATSVTVRLNGIGFDGQVITEDITVTTAAPAAETDLPFFQFTDGEVITIVGTGGAGDLLDVGWSAKAGLLGYAALVWPVLSSTCDGATEVVTVASDVPVVEFTTAPDAVHDYEMVYRVQQWPNDWV